VGRALGTSVRVAEPNSYDGVIPGEIDISFLDFCFSSFLVAR